MRTLEIVCNIEVQSMCVCACGEVYVDCLYWTLHLRYHILSNVIPEHQMKRRQS